MTWGRRPERGIDSASGQHADAAGDGGGGVGGADVDSTAVAPEAAEPLAAAMRT